MLVLFAALVVSSAAQFLPVQVQSSPRQLIFLLQDIQNRLQNQQSLLQNEIQFQSVPQAQPQFQTRVIQINPQAGEVQRQVLSSQRQAQNPPQQSSQPQFLDPGVGRWLISQDQSCLPCICEASSGCDETLGCDQRGFCGAFLLSRRYWDLAGRPLLRGDSASRPGADADCLRDSFCAAEAVRGYLDRFAQDCDGDRRVDCLDLARVHFLGPFNCRNPLNPPNDFSQTFRRCWDRNSNSNRRNG